MLGEEKKKRWRERDDGGRGVEGKKKLKRGRGEGGRLKKRKLHPGFLCVAVRTDFLFLLIPSSLFLPSQK